MQLIDSHCHLDQYTAANSLSDILNRAEAAHITHCITVGTSKKDWALYLQLTRQYTTHISYSVGLHPSYVADDWEAQLASMANFFSNTPPPIAIGEIGLDYFHVPTIATEAEIIIQRQKQAFLKQLQLAHEFNCPVIIHSRHAFSDCVELVHQSGIDWRKVVFHCWTEDASAIQCINDYGGRGSFTGIITYKNATTIRSAALAQGIDKLMIETDSPYLAPMPHRGKQNEPAFTLDIARFCASLFNLSLETFAARTAANTQAFFSIE